MANRQTSSQRTSETNNFTSNKIQVGIKKLQKRISELHDLEQKQPNYKDASVDNIEHAIIDSIRDVFGVNSPQFDRHEDLRIWHGGYNMGDDDYTRQRKFLAGIHQTITILEGLISWLEEKQMDLTIVTENNPEESMSDSEIRKEILHSLKSMFNKNPHMIMGRNELLEQLRIKPEELDRNIKYLEGKGAIRVFWKIGGSFQAKLESFGLDLLDEYLQAKNNQSYPSQSMSSYATNKTIFLAQQFSDENIINKFKKNIEKSGFEWKEGKRDDLGSISEDILKKISSCGFFIAVMTKRDQLKELESYTTSSWLVEEKGAALAFGHRPLIMVQEGVERHYVGYLQKDDQMIYFNESNLETKISEAIRMIEITYGRHNQ